jgi:hypothetical protein
MAGVFVRRRPTFGKPKGSPHGPEPRLIRAARDKRAPPAGGITTVALENIAVLEMVIIGAGG